MSLRFCRVHGSLFLVSSRGHVCFFARSLLPHRQLEESFSYHFSWSNLLSIIFMAALNFKRELRGIENLLPIPVPKERL